MWGTPPGSGFTAKGHLQESTQGVLVQVHHTSVSTFLLSLNALFIVSGFCHVFTKYCRDGFLLWLQAIARENNQGPIWCGASRKFIFGCTSASNAKFFFFFQALHTRNNISLSKGWFSLQKLKCFSTMARKTNVETTVLTGDNKNRSKKSLGTASPRNGTSVWHVYWVSWVFLKAQKFK